MRASERFKQGLVGTRVILVKDVSPDIVHRFLTVPGQGEGDDFADGSSQWLWIETDRGYFFGCWPNTTSFSNGIERDALPDDAYVDDDDLL